ncbi:HD domain-containing phosphohydrolase [Methylomonas sp. AM2-LC]|uniref:HD domain-containing phosphohydrolase n=1 Tax=Methylomonas sp. AM2-LC TaxID=3153301 RepID=UPI0032642F0F
MTDKPSILIVDDQHSDLLILEDLLSRHYQVIAAQSGREALDYFNREGQVDLILLDVLMPDMDGFSVCRYVKENSATCHIPVIFLTSLDSAKDEEFGLQLGAEDFIHKPFSAPVVLARVRTHLSLSAARAELRLHNLNLEQLVNERTQKIREQTQKILLLHQDMVAAQDATIIAFCSLAEARDNETGNHIRRTQNYVRVLAKQLQQHPRFQHLLDDDAIQLLYKSAPLHDIGKVGIPDAILLKPSKLTEEEWQVMRCHCYYGYTAVMSAQTAMGANSDSFLRYAKEITYHHHERWDGSGYPNGLAGESIPLSARLMAIADVYDALISRRVYKEPFPHHQAIEMISAERGRHFDPDMVDAMLLISDQFQEIAKHFNDDHT